MMKVTGVCLNDALEKHQFERFMSFTSVERRERIKKFHRYEDAQRSLVSDILIRFMLCKRLKMKNRELVFGINEYGKPFLANGKNIEFNISHSGGWVVCTIDNLPVGIDVEQVKPVDICIAKLLFSKEEVESLTDKCVADRNAYFYDLWTLKESYIKAVGKGLLIPLSSFTIRITDGNITLRCADEPGNYYFKRYCIDKDYKMAVCSRKNEFPDKVDIVNVNELHDEILSL